MRKKNKKKTMPEIPGGNVRYLVSHTRVYPEVSGLAVWRENCKWYSSLPVGAVI
jgi:hypothetical protein